MPSFARASQSAHPENRIVRYTSGIANRGFLLSRDGAVPNLRHWAMYVDAYNERIDPPQGAPRPTPDPADRTRSQSLPPSLISTDSAGYKLASRFTGQMRKVVQCEYSRGTETRFSHTWARSHGLLEFPFEHVSGRDAAEEAKLRSERRYFVIEVSAAGVFAAPVEFGSDCRNCALVSSYMLPGAATLDLAGYFAANPTGRVQQVMTAEQIGTAYDAGSPWYSGCGWAFSYSGRVASNVVARVEHSGFQFYRTTLVDLEFAVELGDQAPASIIREGNEAVLRKVGHGFAVGEVVAVYGAEQPEYNGARIVRSATDDEVRYAIEGTPASPATGPIRVGSLQSGARVSGAISADTGQVIFKRGGGGTLWTPESPGVWRGVTPPVTSQTVSGPVHVFYDGEEPVITYWSALVENVPYEESVPPGIARWDGGASGVHSYPTETYTVPVVQSPLCVLEGTRSQLAASGSFTSRHAAEVYGFHGPFDARVTAYMRSSGVAVSSVTGSTEEVSIFGNNYALCGGGNGSGTIEQTETWSRVQNVVTRRDNEVRSGCSALILLAEEREAVAAVQVSSSSAAVEQRSFGAVIRSKLRGRKIDGGDSPYTPFDIDVFQYLGPEDSLASAPVASQEVSHSATFMLRGVGEFAYSKPLAIDEAGNLGGELAQFQTFTAGTKETASSQLYFMRGGLFYDEPALSPRDQVGNRVYSIDGDQETQGGFQQLNGKTSVAFVGEV